MACEADGFKVAGVVSPAAGDRDDVVDVVSVERAARSPQLAFVAVPGEDSAAYPLPCGGAGVIARLTGAGGPAGGHLGPHLALRGAGKAPLRCHGAGATNDENDSTGSVPLHGAEGIDGVLLRRPRNEFSRCRARLQS